MIRSREFSQYELVSILEAIESAVGCSTKDDLKSVLVRAREIIGADYAVSGACTLSGVEVLGVDAAVNAGYPEEFVELYLSKHFYRSDPVVRHLSKYSFTQSWTEIFSKTGDAELSAARNVVSAAWDFGLRHGVSTGVFIPARAQLNVFSFAGPADKFEEHQKKLLEVLSLHLSSAMARAVGGARRFDGVPAENNRLQGHD